MRALLHHKPLFLIFREFFRGYIFLRFRVRTQPVGQLQTPCLVLANHTTNYDPIILGMSFPMLLHYLASDHIFRKGLISRLLIALVDPIPRLKATTEVASTKRILQKLRGGDSVCIFPEGNRTWSGESIQIPDSVAKLAKKAGVTLVTYRIEGGYFTSPRWSRFPRRGAVSGSVVKIYSGEELAEMSADDLSDAIQKDLYVNAYEDQRRNPVAFKGKRIAEDLELALYLCPKCGKLGTLSSNGDLFSCQCGLSVRYSQYGDFQPVGDEAPPYDTVLEWFRWQTPRMAELVSDYLDSPGNEALFRDPEQELFLIERAAGQQSAGAGTFCAYKDRLELEETEGSRQIFPWKEIVDISIHGPKVLVFSMESGATYEIRTKTRRSPVKYLDLFNSIKAKN